MNRFLLLHYINFTYNIYLKIFFHKQCNNPQTKEPKLTAAVRIVKEWKDYDEEVKALIEEFNTKRSTHSSTVKKNKDEL